MEPPGLPRPPWWRTVGYVVPCVFASLTTMAYSGLGAEPEHGWQMLLLLVTFVLCFAVPALLFWRHRNPELVTLAAAAVAVVVPLGSWTALVALSSLVARRRGAPVWWAAGAVTVATAVSVLRDIRGPTMGESFLKTVLGPTDAPPSTAVEVSPWVVPAVVLLAMGAAVGVGLLIRARREARSAADRASSHQVATHRLGDQLARQQERERIAREVHDVLGHRLSLLNLHAGAVETRARDHPELVDSARLVRESASRSLTDLRSLLQVLREPVGPGPAAPDMSLADLPAIIDETLQTGMPVTSAVFLEGAESAPAALSRAVYRIVQEVLTNARKHVPGELVRLEVTGGPTRGVTVDARNRYHSPRAAEGAPPGQGMHGIAERVELLGGQLAYGLDDDGRTYRVTAWLPWAGEVA